ncbi:MAG TPA: chemotaxis response regulator protein-glutamate methylesterase [Sphingobacteriaceae bacterium]
MGVIKVLIVDDSALVRQAYSTLLSTERDIEVIGTAGDPYIAVQKIQKEKPDVITLDVEMPRMDGITFLKKLMSQAPMPVVVISNKTVDGAEVALKALEAGAVDVMAKPNVADEVSFAESRIALADKIRSAFHSKKVKKHTEVTPATAKPQSIGKSNFSSSGVIAVGASTGGTEAIRVFLESLTPPMPPILIVQHMPDKFTAGFATRLNELCALNVKEAEDLEPVLPGTVYIAPGNNHMTIANHHGRTVIKISKGELVNRHRPSVNVLFNSVAEVKGKNTIGVILTGMGDDGATGMLAIHERGGYTIAQDEQTSVVFGMPHKAINAGGVSRVLPLHEISRDVLERIG